MTGGCHVGDLRLAGCSRLLRFRLDWLGLRLGDVLDEVGAHRYPALAPGHGLLVAVIDLDERVRPPGCDLPVPVGAGEWAVYDDLHLPPPWLPGPLWPCPCAGVGRGPGPWPAPP